MGLWEVGPEWNGAALMYYVHEDRMTKIFYGVQSITPEDAAFLGSGFRIVAQDAIEICSDPNCTTCPYNMVPIGDPHGGSFWVPEIPDPV